MTTKKGHFLRFSLTHAECGYDHVQVLGKDGFAPCEL